MLIVLGSIGIFMSIVNFYAYYMVKKEQYEYLREIEKREFDSRTKQNLLYVPLFSIALIVSGIYLIK